MPIFKAYDVRGIVPSQLNEKLAEKIGRATVSVLDAKTLAIGRDSRNSGPEISAAFVRGATAAGCNIIDIGPCSTPMSYFAVGSMGTDGAVMVTASHNPPEYNGFKFSRTGGRPVSGESGLKDIEALAFNGPLPEDAAQAGKVTEKNINEEYRQHLLSFSSGLKPIKIAVDTANGAVGPHFEHYTSGLPLEVVPLFFEPDGNFPNHEPNPLKVENMKWLQDAVLENNCQMGVAFDGDGDRAMFVDEKGNIVPSDLLTALLAPWMLRGEKPGSKIIYDLRSSKTVPEEIAAAGGQSIESRVGHSFIKALMREEEAVFAGELSGHYYFRDNWCCDSGEIAFFVLWSLLSESGKPLSELMAPLRRYYASGEINFEVEDKDAAIEKIAQEFADAQIYQLDGISVKYDDWHFNVRKSNTEPLLRLTLEAKTEAGLTAGLKRVKTVLGV